MTWLEEHEAYKAKIRKAAAVNPGDRSLVVESWDVEPDNGSPVESVGGGVTAPAPSRMTLTLRGSRREVDELKLAMYPFQSFDLEGRAAQLKTRHKILSRWLKATEEQMVQLDAEMDR